MSFFQVVIVSLDEDRLYAAGGADAVELRGSGIPHEENDQARSAIEHANWADDRRLKESWRRAPNHAMALLQRRIEGLRHRARVFPGALPVKHFDSPFQYAPQPESLALMASLSDDAAPTTSPTLASTSSSGSLDSASSPNMGEASSSSAAAARNNDVGVALGGASPVTVGIRDAFLTFTAMVIGHYRQFVFPPSKLLAQNNLGTTSSNTAEALERMGIDEWFDFPGFGKEQASLFYFILFYFIYCFCNKLVVLNRYFFYILGTAWLPACLASLRCAITSRIVSEG